MMKYCFPEIGYTPDNLRYLIKLLGITQARAAELVCVNPRVLRTWLAKSDKVSHHDMPLDKWRKLLAQLPLED